MFILLVIIVDIGRFLTPRHIDFIEINIDRNTTGRQIAHKLKDRGIISSEFLFITITKIRGLEGELKSGLYHFSDDYTLNRVIDKLVNSLLYVFYTGDLFLLFES